MKITDFLKKLFWIGLFLMVFQIIGQAQETFKRTDVVYLKNGSIFRGQIESYKIGKTLKLRLDKDKIIIFEDKNIKKIVQETTPEEDSEKVEKTIVKNNPYKFRERGIYIASHIGYLGGNDFLGNYKNAYNIHLQSGFQFNRLVGAGLGIGIDFYNINLGSVIPIYAAFRGYAKRSNVSPYYQVAAGYGFPMMNENSAFTSSNGGYYLAPETGIRIGASDETNMTIGIGLQWQKASYRQEFEGGTVLSNEDDYTFRRFNFKIGILF